MFDRPFFLSLSTALRYGNIPRFGWFSPSKYLLLSILLLALVYVNPVNAEWGRAADEYFRLPLYRDAHICSDGNGGCWATGEGVGLSHVDRNGNLTWGMEPFFLRPGYGNNPRPVLADNGDVIVGMDVYNENTGLTDVYLQRVNLDQELLWGENGIQIDTSSRYEAIINTYKGLVNDTYLIHWIRHNGHWRNYENRLQLINGDGEFLWSVGGIGLNRLESNSRTAKLTFSSDRCIIAMFSIAEDDEGDLEVLKINSDGENLWNNKFAILTETLRRKLLRDIESDRDGGAILIYESDSLYSVEDSIRYYGIKAMRISGDGDSLWTRLLYEREVLRGSETFGRIYPILNYASSGRFFIAWEDYPHSFQVIALNLDGEYIWHEPVDIMDTLVTAGSLDAVDSQEGVCYAWKENADRGNGVRQQQWGQRISANGDRLWGDRGRAIQARNVSQSSIASDGNGGVITVVDAGPTIQMINRNGEIGVVLETSVKDDKRKSLNLSPQLFIYPNPGNTHFRIEYDTGIPNDIVNYCIYNLLGRTIQTGILRGGYTIINDLTTFSSGEYILRLQSPRTSVSTRFLLIK